MKSRAVLLLLISLVLTTFLPPQLFAAGGLTQAEPKAYGKKIGTLNPLIENLSVSFPLPIKVQSPPANSNVKIWIYDPKNLKKGISRDGIFKTEMGKDDWKEIRANNDGSLYASWPKGKYTIDVIEPNSDYSRKSYTAEVDAQGVFSVNDLTPNSDGFFTLTVDIAPKMSSEVAALVKKGLALLNVPASKFKQTSPCQLRDKVTEKRGIDVGLMAGFPKVPIRLKSFGRIKALIVPVDFSDVKGKDDPLKFFGKIGSDVSNFYYKQSYGKLTFDFDIVPQWIRAPFTSTKYGMGSLVGSGDPNGYNKALLDFTDGPIEYRGYDAIYFLVPQEMPMENMGWGPAVVNPMLLKKTIISNQALGGADGYFNEKNGDVGGAWKWMAHETGHTFGLYDEDFEHKKATLGSWSIMANNWSRSAIELGAWDRYLQGWLTNAQITCLPLGKLTKTGSRFEISPIVRNDAKIKSIMIPLTKSKILVIESRKNEGLDKLKSDQEGVLIYTVDMNIGQIKGGYQIQKRKTSVDPEFIDGALQVGDSLTIGGVKISVITITGSLDSVQVSKV